MTYKVEQAIDKLGKDVVLKYIFEEGINQIELHKYLKLSTSNTRLSSQVYKRIYKHLDIQEMPYPKVSNPISRKFMCQYDIYNNYWESEFLVQELLNRLANPITNIVKNRKRYVISFPRHPNANKDSCQVKAHIIVWELYNKQYLSDNYRVIALDNDYTNLDISNLKLVNTTEYKSASMLGDNNPAFKHGMSQRPKLGGWNIISELKRAEDKGCKICASTKDLVVHHIINYNLFNNPNSANQLLNLITLCRSCHTKLHAHNTNIKDLIEVTQYSKLLELLETLKSQVPDHLLEILSDVEQQLGLTGNQQPSI